MRVLLTADTLGGVWTYATELAHELEQRGCDVLVASFGRAPAQHQLRMLGSVDHVSWEGALEWMPDPWNDVEAAGEWLLEVHGEFRSDLVHLNNYAHAALEFHAPVIVVAHSCVLSWFAAVRRQAAPATWTGYRARVEEGLCAADAVVAPTRAMLTALQQHYSFTTSAFVIPNGRRTPTPAPKRPFIAAVGRMWDEAKNVAAVERVAAQLSWPVRIAGDGTDAGYLEQRELARWLSHASIFVSPALYEPFGLTALEAAGAGCALVLGDIDSLREVWDETAVYVDPRDDAGLASNLQTLIDDGGLRERLGEAARRRAQQYTPQRMADAYCALYTRLVAHAAQPERV